MASTIPTMAISSAMIARKRQSSVFPKNVARCTVIAVVLFSEFGWSSAKRCSSTVMSASASFIAAVGAR